MGFNSAFKGLNISKSLWLKKGS